MMRSEKSSKQKTPYIIFFAAFIITLFGDFKFAYSTERTLSHIPDSEVLPGKTEEPIKPIQSAANLKSSKVLLGDKLFHDKRLGSPQNLSCSGCHNLAFGGTDQLAFSVNNAGKPAQFNTPTIFNVSLNSQYYWSGKFQTLADQMDDALREINTSWPELIQTINNIPEYVNLFNHIYTDGITVSNIKDAFISFENSLLTPDSPFDKYLNGDKTALNSRQLQGYKLFKTYGCITCHQGANIGGNFVIDIEKLDTPFGKLKSTRQRLNGKLKYIRVPSLRNIAVTAPYFHDGSATTLYQAVQRMIDEYLGIDVSDHHVYLVVSFLKTLTGEYKGKSL